MQISDAGVCGQGEFHYRAGNDGSRDTSSQICKQLYNEYPDLVTYVELSRNFGEHNALMAGLHYVTGDYCIMMDDDLQNPPQEAHVPNARTYFGSSICS